MMTLANQSRYRQYRHQPDPHLLYELWLPMLLFGSMGAITWAIRGTNGWGGIDGTLVPGLTWGLLWYYLCWRKGIDARSLVLWLGLGLALGGELGYGQYVSWIQGRFYVADNTLISVSPWIGYSWFVICGIGWGAPGGILLSWALNQKVPVREWLVRSGFMILLLLILFNIPIPGLGNGAISGLGDQLLHYCPGILFPNAGLDLYSGELNHHLSRTVYTNTQNFAMLLWWIGALLAALFQRDKNTLLCGILIGGGFGFGFAFSAVWCLGYRYAPGWIDWWKMWELHAGFNLGMLYALTLFWATRQVNTTHTEATPVTPENGPKPAAFSNSRNALFPAIVGFLLIFAVGMEYFLWTGLLLALFYAVSVGITVQFKEKRASEIRKGISLTYSVFLLLFLLAQGGSSRFGVLLGMYGPEAIEQYDWPVERIALFAPVAVILFSIAVMYIVKHYRAQSQVLRLPERMIDLCTFITLTGAVSIWPAKIGVLYIFFLCLALFAFTRIERHYLYEGNNQ